jgi:hypothetical protein
MTDWPEFVRSCSSGSVHLGGRVAGCIPSLEWLSGAQQRRRRIGCVQIREGSAMELQLIAINANASGVPAAQEALDCSIDPTLVSGGLR